MFAKYARAYFRMGITENYVCVLTFLYDYKNNTAGEL